MGGQLGCREDQVGGSGTNLKVSVVTQFDRGKDQFGEDSANYKLSGVSQFGCRQDDRGVVVFGRVKIR